MLSRHCRYIFRVMSIAYTNFLNFKLVNVVDRSIERMVAVSDQSELLALKP